MTLYLHTVAFLSVFLHWLELALIYFATIDVRLILTGGLLFVPTKKLIGYETRGIDKESEK